MKREEDTLILQQIDTKKIIYYLLHLIRRTSFLKPVGKLFDYQILLHIVISVLDTKRLKI